MGSILYPTDILYPKDEKIDPNGNIMITRNGWSGGIFEEHGFYINLYWKVVGTMQTNLVQFTGGESNPARLNNLTPNATIEYYLTGNGSGGYARTQTSTVETYDTKEFAPINLSPKNERVDGNISNIFSWVHTISTGTEQTKAELEYSANNGATYTNFATVEGSANSVVITEGTLPTGAVLWRVRTYNIDNVAGNYSEPAMIYIKAKPNPPIISIIENKPLCVIGWDSPTQAGYRVIITDSEGKTEDTGERYGAEKTYTSKTILADGEATVTVYIGNTSGDWNFATSVFNVQNVPEQKFDVSTERKPYETTFTFNGEAYITRNGELIGKGNGTFTDRAGAGRCIYNVIKLNNGYYTKSEDIVVLYDRIKTAVVYDVENNGKFIVLNIRKESPVIIDKGFSASVAYNNYCGAEFPTAYYSGYKNEGISLEVTRTIDNNTAIRSLLGKLCCLKDKQGESVYCVLNSINESVERWNDISLSFTRVNYENGVNYET